MGVTNVMSSKVMSAQERLDHMRQGIREGGSALFNGQVISHESQLPTLTDLAGNDGERFQALSDIEARRRQLDEEESRLRAAQAATAVPESALKDAGSGEQQDLSSGGKKDKGK